MNENIILLHYLKIGDTGLGSSIPNFVQSNKTAICQRFNGCSYAITITLKGAYAIRSLASNFDKQYQLFKNIISNIIHKYASEYCFYFELHKCGEWLHTHGVLNLKKS